MAKLIAVRLEDEHIEKLEQLVQMSGWNQSEVLRRLIENGWVKPPAVGSSITIKPEGVPA